MEQEAAPAAAGSAGDAQQSAQQAAETAAAAAPAVGFAKRKNRGTLRKRAADIDDGGGGGGDDGGGVQRKAAKAKEGSMAFTTKRSDREQVFAFESSNAVQQARDGGATRTNEQETAFDRDARYVVECPMTLRCGTPIRAPLLRKCVVAYILAGWLPIPRHFALAGSFEFLPDSASLRPATLARPAAAHCVSRFWRKHAARRTSVAKATGCTVA